MSSNIEADKIHFLLQDRRSTTPQNEYDQVKKVNLSQLINMINAVGGSELPSSLSITEEISECGSTGIQIATISDNGWIAISPTGTGFLTTTVPDGTTGGGNCRGTLAIDWQTIRTSPDQVASGDYSVISGGRNNLNMSLDGVISGGNANTILSDYGVIGGGKNNMIESGANYAVIAGGNNNTIIEGSVSTHAFIGAGSANYIKGGNKSAIISGGNNTIEGYLNFIGGGYFNNISTPDPLGNRELTKYNIILGGTSNSILGTFIGDATNHATYNVIGSGKDNLVIQSDFSSIINGKNNTITSSNYSVITGGLQNYISINNNCVIGGGSLNSLTYCNNSVIVGGKSNKSSSNYTFIGGGQANLIFFNCKSSVIVGGECNSIVGILGISTRNFIGGGGRNSINNTSLSSIVGGYYNNIEGDIGFIGGGRYNAINSSYYGYTISSGSMKYNVVVGGRANSISIINDIDSSPTAEYNFIGGGKYNRITESVYSSVLGGQDNKIGSSSSGPANATILGGKNNSITGDFSIILGGECNSITLSRSSIINGTKNTISASNATILGGSCNMVSGAWSIILGGNSNSISGDKSSIINGAYNTILGSYSSILGGSNNSIGSDRAIIGGSNVSTIHDNVFCWGDGSAATASTANNSVCFRASNGFGIIGDLTANSIVSNTTVQASGNINAPNINASNINAGNVQAANMQASGNINAPNINATNINATNINTGNVQAGNVQAANMQASGNINAPNINATNINVTNVQAVSIQSRTLQVSQQLRTPSVLINTFGTITGNDWGIQAQQLQIVATCVKILGQVSISGTLNKSSGSFKIDHPLEPYNKFLYHSFVESPDMLNIYSGTCILDNAGECTIILAEWFESLNRDFTYQLTPIGKPCSTLFISQKIKDNKFKISGGFEDLEVCWSLTGIRQDLYAIDNRMKIEKDKGKKRDGVLIYDPFTNSNINIPPNKIDSKDKKIRQKYIDNLLSTKMRRKSKKKKIR